MCLSLVFGLVPGRSTTAVLPTIPRPSEAEIATVRELARLVPGRNSFHAFSGDDLAVNGASGAGFAVVSGPSAELTRRLVQGFPYGGEIADAADRNNLDSLFLAAVVEVESGFDARAVSPRGAAGLMQVMPAFAGVEADTLLNPRVNLDVGARYMSSLLGRFDGDLELTLAAYNAGPAAVRRFGGVPPYRETTKFVTKVLRLYSAHRQSATAQEVGNEFALSNPGRSGSAG